MNLLTIYLLGMAFMAILILFGMVVLGTRPWGVPETIMVLLGWPFFLALMFGLMTGIIKPSKDGKLR